MAYDWSAAGAFSARPTYDLYLYIRRDQTDVANNRSSYAYQLVARWRSGSPRAWTAASSSGTVWIGSGAWNHSGTLDFRSTDTIILGSGTTDWFTHDANGNLNLFPQAAWSSDNFGSASLSGTFSTDRIVPNAPTAPSKPAITRNSDTSHTLSWARNASGIAPYTQQQVLRRTYTDGAWGSYAAIASFGTDATSGTSAWTDTSTVANRIYQYIIKVTNISGEAYSPASVYAYTTPAAPTAVSAVKQASGSIVISLTPGVTHTDYTTTLQYSTNGGTAWTALTSLASGTLSYTWSSVPAGSAVVFRAQTVINAPGNTGQGLTSAWAQSNAVPLTAPPSPPAALVPNGLAFDAATAQVFSWQHNPTDSSVQTAYSLRYRIGEGTWTTIAKTTSGTSSRTFAAGTFTNGNAYQWQVQTWGAHANPSDWSAVATFTASASPSVNITAPGATLATSLVTAAWTYTDPEGTAQSAWEAQLLLAGTVIEAKSGSGTATSTAFSTRLDNATAYQVRVRIRDGSSLWSSWAQQTFTTSFPSPAAPQFTATWNEETGAATINVANPSGPPAVAYNTLLRSLDNGQTWTTVATVPVNGMGIDPTIPLGQDVRYKVVAWASLPSSSESTVAIVNSDSGHARGAYGGYWSAGANFGNLVRMLANTGAPPKIEMQVGGAHKTLHYFAGRVSPVETMGTAISRTGSAEFIVLTEGDRDQVVSMALLPAPHLFRLPDGTTVYASIGPVAVKRISEGAYSVSLSLTEVDR